MAGRKTISIAGDNEHGGFQSGNLLAPIIILTEGFSHVGNQSRKIFWLGCKTQIAIIDGSIHKELRGEGCHSGLHFGMPASPFERGRDQHEVVDPFWMANGGLKSYGTAKRKAKQVGFFESEMLDQASDIISHVLKAEGAIREGGTSVPIQIDTNDLITRSQHRRKSSEHLKGAKATVKHDQGRALSMNLIVQGDSIDNSVVSCWMVCRVCHKQLLLTFLAFCKELCYRYILIARCKTGEARASVSPLSSKATMSSSSVANQVGWFSTTALDASCLLKRISTA